MGTLRHKERHADAVGVEGGRSGFKTLAVGFGIAHLLIHHLQHRFPIRRDSGEEGEQIGNADVIHGAGIFFRRERHTGKGGVTAITAAVNGNAFRVGNALADEPVHAVGNVVLHAQTPLSVTGFEETATVARGTAKVHLEHGIASIAQELRFGRKAPTVACPGTAVGIYHHGQGACRFGREAAGEREIGFDAQAVARGVGHGVHFRHVCFGKLRGKVGEFAQRVGCIVVIIIGTARAVAAYI